MKEINTLNRLDKSNDRMVVGNEILEAGNQIQDLP